MSRITVVSLGPGPREYLTLGALSALEKAEKLVLRTARHPMATWLEQEEIPFDALDDLYEACEDFDEFNQAASRRLAALCEKSPVCYAVSDAAFDTTVAALQQLLPQAALQQMHVCPIQHQYAIIPKR